MTRAKQELYLCHARLREFRGQTLYAVPSMFLEELPPEGATEVPAEVVRRVPELEPELRSFADYARAYWVDPGTGTCVPAPSPGTPR